MYRYWTGTEWTAAITANPAATPPPTGPAPQGPPPPNPNRPKVGWWIGGIAAVVALGLVITLVIQGVGRTVTGNPPGSSPGSNPTQNICPPLDRNQSTTPPPQHNDGRVHGGKISYPMLQAPWGPVSGDDRVPFARDVAEQTVMVQENYDGEGASWVASVLVSELVAGDGFFSPEQGADIVMRCVVGRFYSNAVVDREDLVSKAIKVDGHDAWVIESQLSFDIPKLETKGELAIVVVVDTGVESASLYYASIPDTVPDLVDDARSVLANLKVDA